MHAVLFGASRGIGYFTALYLLAKPSTSAQAQWTITMLLRKPEMIQSDPKFKDYLGSGRLTLVKGDATDEGDVRKVANGGNDGKKVDLILSSIGSAPTMTYKGVRLQGRPDPCTAASAVLFKVLAEKPGPYPRIIGVSSMGIGENHKYMPLFHRVLYPLIGHHAHIDKEGLEYLFSRVSSGIPTPTKHIPPPHILPVDTLNKSPENLVNEIIIVRPALLIGDNAEPREKEPTAGEQVSVSTIRRSEVGKFIVDQCLPGDDRWVNKAPAVGF